MKEAYRIEPNPVAGQSYRRLTDGEGRPVAIMVPRKLAPMMAHSPRLLAACRRAGAIGEMGVTTGRELHEALLECAAAADAADPHGEHDRPVVTPDAAALRLHSPEVQ